MTTLVPVTPSSSLSSLPKIKEEGSITNQEIMDHVIQNAFGFEEVKYKTIEDWMHYKGLDSFPDVVLEFLKNAWRLQDQTLFKKDGTTHEIQQATTSKIWVLILWVND